VDALLRAAGDQSVQVDDLVKAATPDRPRASAAARAAAK
jgi:hypothetical protein